MANQRHKLWYSIISYIPNLITYERVNIGIIIGNPETNEITYSLLPERSKKFRYFFWNSIERKIYKNSVEYLEFLLKKIQVKPTIFQVAHYEADGDWNNFLGGKISENIVFSKIHFAITDNDINIFNNLISTYIGDDFFPKQNSNIITLKKHVYEIFESNKLINTKLKSNLKIKPSAELPLKFEMDYTYFTQKNQVSFIQIGPKQSQINEWYKNNVTLLSKNSDNVSSNMVIKEDDYENPNQTFKPFLRDLESDERVKPTIVTNKDSLSKLVKNAGEAIPISEWNTEDKSYIA